MAPEHRPDEFNPYRPPTNEDMIDKAKATHTEGIDLAAESPFLTIWTRPRATIRAIVDTNPFLHVALLAMVGGVVQTVDRAVQRNAGDTLSLPAILGLAVLFGPIGGLIGLFVGGWFVRTAHKHRSCRSSFELSTLKQCRPS